MAKFENAIGDILEAEGGYVNHPADRGGPTNWGITQATLSAYRKKSATIDDVKNMRVAEAKDIYKKNYWDSLNLDKIDSQLIADMVFDQSVNRGPITAAKNLQESYNNISPTKLVVDGKIGDKSVLSINQANEVALAAAFLKDAQLDYATIVANNASQRVFIRGWINRTHKLFDKILESKAVAPIVTDTQKKSDGAVKSLIECVTDFFKGGEEKVPVVVDEEKSLLQLILENNPSLPKEGVERMLKFQDKAKKKDRMIFVNFNEHDTSKRMYVIDAKTGKADRYLTSHGAKSDPNKDGYPTEFSNVNGSNMSSLGAMITDNLYGKAVGGWSKFTHALKIHGLEVGTNDNVYDRAMVFHEANYVATGGDSLGCFALTPTDAAALIPGLAGGYLLYAHYQPF